MTAIVDTSRYIAFEGIEGAGKSSVSIGVAAALETAGYPVVLVREPGGTPAGEAIRSVLLDGDVDPGPWSEAALFAAARAELVSKRVVPALERGAWVVSDRSAYSSLAYQAGGRGLPLDRVRLLNDIAIEGVWPGRVVLLRLDASDGLARQAVGDRIGDEGDEFHRSVAQAFDDLADAEPGRFVVIDASQSLVDVVDEVIAALGVT